MNPIPFFLYIYLTYIYKRAKSLRKARKVPTQNREKRERERKKKKN